MIFKTEELETRRELEEATKALHKDIHNVEMQGIVINKNKMQKW